MVFNFDIPLPPSKNHQYGRSRRGGTYLAKHVVAFREEIAKQFKDFETIETPAILRAWFSPTRRGRFDQHNRMPQLCDALEKGGVISDDSLFVETHSWLGPVVRPRGACRIEIEVLP